MNESRVLLTHSQVQVPAIIASGGRAASRRFLEFFAATVRNKNTRDAYANALRGFFDWCSERRYTSLYQLEPITVAAYIEQLGHSRSRPTVKQHLAAINRLFDWLVVGQIVPSNPASSVRGPTHVVTRGKTPVLDSDEARRLIDSIDTTTLIGLRDRALIAAMIYSFGRVSAVTGMLVEDYYVERKRSWLRLHEKGGRLHQVPLHHKADEYLDEYLQASGIQGDNKSPLFRTVDQSGALTSQCMTRFDAFRMIKRHVRAAGLLGAISPHSLRATGITTFRRNGGTLENAQKIAAHASPRTTKLYDHTSDDITLDEIERILI